MPSFSNASNGHLDSCCLEIRIVLHAVVECYDCTVIEGHRGQADQDEYFRTGRSRVQWPNGKHNTLPSLAVDVAPYPIDWNDRERFVHFAGYVLGVANNCGYRWVWGGDWDSDHDLRDQTFMDLVHFEHHGPR